VSTLSGKSIIAGVASAILLAAGGCANNPKKSETVGALPSNTSCQSLQSELNKLDSRGLPSLVESANAGKKLSPSQRADIDRYNDLLSKYLGAKCHV
jgi:hypothetical protein